MPYVLAISVGPVQEFIAAARKSRDLWFGSQLLSELAHAVAKDLHRSGAQLVFPPASLLDTSNSVANKIVAIIPSGLDPAVLSSSARAAARRQLSSRARETIGYVADKRLTEDIDRELFDEQIEHFLEYYDAWQPFDDESEYPDKRKAADRLLAGRKALRDFRQPAASRGYQKSSLDGGRETVITTRDEDRLSRLNMKRGEFLDGVSLIKRTAGVRPFVSVSRVAVDPFIRRIAGTQDVNDLAVLAKRLARAESDEEAVRPLSGEFGEIYQSFPYDTQLFFDDERADDEPSDAQLFRRKVHDICMARKTGEITPYLATLIADGDSMGVAVGSLQTPEGHQELSRALAGFAGGAAETVARHSGALLYSGGDDVVAFLPLDKALTCADELRRQFQECLERTGLQVVPTLSVGLSIAHFRSHLDSQLRWARAAEHAAKENGRNSLAVIVHTGSAGEACVMAVSNWNSEPVTNRWRVWIDLLKGGGLSRSAIYRMRALAREMSSLGQRGTPLAEALKAEVLRIAKHSRRSRSDDKLDDKVIDILVSATEGTAHGLDRLVNDLLIARHFARAEMIAGGMEATDL